MTPTAKQSRFSFMSGGKAHQEGFTLLELLIATALSLLVLGLVVGIFTSQRDTFTLQNQLAKMQGNGRAAVDFVTRAIQNSGYNVTRGTRFLAASDHYVTSVFDEDNDGVIQNDEVITFAVSNSTGTGTETFTISPYFDMDADDNVDGSETRDYIISLTLVGPPYHVYKILPNVADSNYTKHKVAQYVDNMIIRYYDKNDDPLPSGVTVDGNGDPVPPYVLADSELNDIRRVEIEILARTKDPDSNDKYVNSGTYVSGSAATLGGSSSYSDGYHREQFSAITSPRNLVMAPWGKVSISANPNPVTCPEDSTTVTASVVDSDGDAVSSGIDVTFTASDGTVSPTTDSTDASGEASTTLTYDWSSPSVTVTISASGLLTVSGTDYPVFNAVPIVFETGTGILTDNFNDGDADGWSETGSVNWSVASGQYKTASNGWGASLNGCDAWQDYEMQMDYERNGSLGTDEYSGMILRYQSDTQHYLVRIYCTLCTGAPASHVYKLQIAEMNSTDTVLAESTVTVDQNTHYTVKASVVGSDIKAKFWETAGSEPSSWDLTATDSSFADGKIGLVTDSNVARFDDVSVTPAS